MIQKTNGKITGEALPFLSFQNRSIIGDIIGIIARYLRTKHTEKYIDKANSLLLDIGCGDGYFIRTTKVRNCIGIDIELGDDIAKLIQPYSNSFDYITMLAVVEHIERRMLKHYFGLMYNFLKPGGHLIITTPSPTSKLIINFLYRCATKDHEQYFDYRTLNNILKDKFLIKEYSAFALGFNQVFYCIKK